MTGKDIAGIVILIVCCWGSAALFYGIGVWASKRKEPMHFWAGTEIDPKTISDIPAYNRENGRMWKLYSLPYWLAGFCGVFGEWETWLSILCLILLALSCTVGIWWLVREYRRIERTYRIPQ